MHHQDGVVGAHKGSMDFTPDRGRLLAVAANHHPIRPPTVFDGGAFLQEFRYRTNVDTRVSDPLDTLTYAIVGADRDRALDRDDVITDGRACDILGHCQHTA